MSQSTTFTSFAPARSTKLTGLISFYRRWFASETVFNKNALEELGLGTIFGGH